MSKAGFTTFCYDRVDKSSAPDEEAMSLAGPRWPCCRTLVVLPCTRLARFCRRRHKIDPKVVIAGSVFSVSNRKGKRMEPVLLGEMLRAKVIPCATMQLNRNANGRLPSTAARGN